jgi:pimeloyl-ACP methyl ester carboxylesterase
MTLPIRTVALVSAAVLAVALVVVGATQAYSAPRPAPDPAADRTPDTAALAGPLADQRLRWGRCEFEGALPEGADTSNVRCATIRVPRDWTDPDPRKTFHLRISQAKNVDPDSKRYGTTMLIHPGGPVSPGLQFAAAVQHGTPALRRTTNYVSFDQRGIGQSSRPKCHYRWDPANTDVVGETRAIAEACRKSPAVAAVTTEQTAYDMDFIRHLLGLEQVSYLGYSYGTWLGAWFGELFAPHIERMVLDSAIDPTLPSIQRNFELQDVARERQFRLHALNYVARHDATYGLGTDPKAIWTRFRAATSSPEQVVFARETMNADGSIGAFASNQLYPQLGQAVRAIIDQAESGKPYPTPVVPEPAGRKRTFESALYFTACTDGQWTQGPRYYERRAERIADRSPITEIFGLIEGPPPCAWWPTDSAMPEAGPDFPETIVVQAEHDSQTPFESGRGAGTKLPNTTLVAVDNQGTHGVYPFGIRKVNRVVNRFLLGGERPARTVVAQGVPLPGEDTVYESWTPLDRQARHHGRTPRFTDPWRPAYDSGRTRDQSQG